MESEERDPRASRDVRLKGVHDSIGRTPAEHVKQAADPRMSARWGMTSLGRAIRQLDPKRSRDPVACARWILLEEVQDEDRAHDSPKDRREVLFRVWLKEHHELTRPRCDRDQRSRNEEWRGIRRPVRVQDCARNDVGRDQGHESSGKDPERIATEGEDRGHEASVLLVSQALEDAEVAIRTHPAPTVEVYERGVELHRLVADSELLSSSAAFVGMRYCLAMSFMSAWYHVHGDMEARDGAREATLTVVEVLGFGRDFVLREILTHEKMWRRHFHQAGVGRRGTSFFYWFGMLTVLPLAPLILLHRGMRAVLR
jgi:hypothetical protein